MGPQRGVKEHQDARHVSDGAAWEAAPPAPAAPNEVAGVGDESPVKTHPAFLTYACE